MSLLGTKMDLRGKSLESRKNWAWSGGSIPAFAMTIEMVRKMK